MATQGIGGSPGSKKQLEQLAVIPEKDFDYGGHVDITQAEFESTREESYADNEIVQAVQAGVWKGFQQNPSRRARTYISPSRLNQDDRKMGTCATPVEYFTTLLISHKPRGWFDLKRVVEALGCVRPDQQPSETDIYHNTKTRLEKIHQYRQDHDYKFRGAINFELPDEDTLEAIRIYGEASKLGVGTLPAQIAYYLRLTGLVWLMVDPDKRKIPLFWEKYIQAMEAQKSSSEGDADSQRGNAGPRPDEDDLRFGEEKTETHQPKADEDEFSGIGMNDGDFAELVDQLRLRRLEIEMAEKHQDGVGAPPIQPEGGNEPLDDIQSEKSWSQQSSIHGMVDSSIEMQGDDNIVLDTIEDGEALQEQVNSHEKMILRHSDKIERLQGYPDLCNDLILKVDKLQADLEDVEKQQAKRQGSYPATESAVVQLKVDQQVLGRQQGQLQTDYEALMKKHEDLEREHKAVKKDLADLRANYDAFKILGENNNTALSNRLEALVKMVVGMGKIIVKEKTTARASPVGPKQAPLPTPGRANTAASVTPSPMPKSASVRSGVPTTAHRIPSVRATGDVTKATATQGATQKSSKVTSGRTNPKLIQLTNASKFSTPTADTLRSDTPRSSTSRISTSGRQTQQGAKPLRTTNTAAPSAKRTVQDLLNEEQAQVGGDVDDDISEEAVMPNPRGVKLKKIENKRRKL
ncbi:hypothetical protein F5Y13DRAFT_199468 [Hypoxylon sp. FL1857]|nr:hypothetical protein F5Y13DRAFT_199468 [Hypoxylon sp. FL1857]